MSEYNLEGYVHPDSSWTRFAIVRTTTDHGIIEFDPGVKPGQVLTMRLRNARNGDLFTDEIVWGPGEYGRKIMATDVLPGTRFTIDATGSGGQSWLTGKLFTA